MKIKDISDGRVFEYGLDRHDALRISDNGRSLSYENLQNGEGSTWGEYRFVTDAEVVPSEDKDLVAHGADAYFNIGGFALRREGRSFRGVVKAV